MMERVMKKICDYRVEVAFDGEHFEDTSIWKHFCYANPWETTNEVNTFEDLQRIQAEGWLMNSEKGRTIFGKEAICVSSAVRDFKKKITARNFKPMKIRVRYIECAKDYSVRFLMGNLPASEFVEWAKDHDLHTIY